MTQQPPADAGRVVDGAAVHVIEGRGVLGRLEVTLAADAHEFDDGRVELVVVKVGVIQDLACLKNMIDINRTIYKFTFIRASKSFL